MFYTTNALVKKVIGLYIYKRKNLTRFSYTNICKIYNKTHFIFFLKTVLGVEFSFDGKMYKQIDGVAMGSPLGPILANIFVGYLES